MKYLSTNKLVTAKLISTDKKSIIKFGTLGYEYFNATNKYDADWYINFIELIMPHTTASLKSAIVEGKALIMRYEELNMMIKDELNTIDFSFTEPEFSMTLECINSSDVQVKGELMCIEDASSESIIKFSFKTNMTNLKAFTEGINLTLMKYPSRYYSGEFSQ